MEPRWDIAAEYKSTLAKLPIELRQCILLSLPSVLDLPNAVEAMFLFHEALYLHPDTILNALLRQSMSDEILFECFAVCQVSNTQIINPIIVRDFMESYFEHVPGRKRIYRLSLSAAVRIEQFYWVVHEAALGFAQHALPKPIIPYGKVLDNYPLSVGELYRVQRAFCRYELYCMLFKCTDANGVPRISKETQIQIFLRQFPPWENEQLACIHDYLIAKISPIINHVAAHDVEWGAHAVPYAANTTPGCLDKWRRHFISHGLVYINHITKARDNIRHFDGLYHPQKRYERLNLPLQGRVSFLDDNLRASNGPIMGHPLWDYHDEKSALKVSERTNLDENYEPTVIWAKSHEAIRNKDNVLERHLYHARRAGYVFWDHSRLASAGVLDAQWPFPTEDCALINRFRYGDRKACLSQEMRYNIYMAGGRGWWTEGDESRVTYGHSLSKSRMEPQFPCPARYTPVL